MRKILFLFILFFGYPVYSQDTLSIGEVFDFKIGDVFHLRDEGQMYYLPNYDYKIDRITITDKYFTPGEDTLIYKRHIEGYGKLYTGEGLETTYNFHSSSDSVLYTCLDSSILFYIKETYYNYDEAFFEYGELSTSESETFCNGLPANEFMNCYWNCDVFRFAKGAGQTGIRRDAEECQCTMRNQYLIYYFKADSECGTPDNFNSIDSNSILLNPVIIEEPDGHKIQLKLSTHLNNANLSLFTINGQLLRKKSFIGTGTSLNTESLSDGIYFILIESDAGEGFVKWIK